jgi:Tfp pilus assembly protein PilN
MPYINLIQEQRQGSRRNELKSRAGFFTFAGVLIVFGAALLTLFTKTASLNSDESTLRATLAQLAPTVAQIQKNKTAEEELRPKLASLEAAQDMTQKWVRILTHFETQTPGTTWLTGVRSIGQDPDMPVTVTLVGMSTAQEPVSEFILRTQNEPDLDDVALHFTNEKVSPYGNTIEFEVGAQIKGTAPEKIKETTEAPKP